MNDRIIIGAAPPRGKSDWRSNSRQRPCPICGKFDNCKIANNGLWVWCGRISHGALKQNLGGQHLHRLTGEQRSALPPPAPSPNRESKNRTPQYFERLASEHIQTANRRSEKLTELADRLGVSIDSLKRLRVGYGMSVRKWRVTQPEPTYFFPEADSLAQIVGINRRFESDGEKKMVPDSDRGLYFDVENLGGSAGPIYIVEGASDTAALLTMERRVVGRMNNAATKFLPELLRDCTGDIVFVGERDLKDDGQWPGHDGPMKSAKVLANALGRRVFFGFAPDDAKDSRAYLNAADRWLADPKAAGQKFTDSLAATAEVIEPDVAPDDVDSDDDDELCDINAIPFLADPRPDVHLEECRALIQQQRINSIGEPGIYLDLSQPGAGKSFAGMAAIGKLGEEASLTARPTHENLREWKRDCLAMHGPDFSVAIYPQRNEESCQNIALANYVDSVGLQASSVVCPTCIFRNNCRFLADKAEFDDARHQGVTHTRLAIQPERMHGKKYITIDENPVAIIRPMKTATVREMERVAEVLTQAKKLAQGDDIVELSRCIGEKLAAAKFILSKVKEAERLQETIEIVPPPDYGTRYNGLQAAVWRAIEGNDELEKPFGDAMSIVDALATGKLHHAAIAWNATPEMEKYLRKNAMAGRPLIHAVWDNSAAFPDDATIWISDATSIARSNQIESLEKWREKNGIKPGEQLPTPTDADGLEALIGRPVRDCTLFGKLPRVVEGVQWDLDVTQYTSDKVVASLLAGVVWRHPTAKKIGFLGHQVHAVNLFKRKRSPLDKVTRSRFSAEHVNYFGSGADRGSNEWLECDLIVICGTPRVSPAAVKAELIRRSDFAATNRDGEWHTYKWKGQTAEGDPVFVTGYGYADSSWKSAHIALTQAALIQAVGRARLSDAAGVPVVVLSNEPGLGLPIAIDNATAKVRCTAIQAAEALEQLGGSRTAAEIGREMRVSRVTAWRYLKDAAALQWVKPSRKRWTITAAWTERAQVSETLINIIGKVKPSADLKATATDDASDQSWAVTASDALANAPATPRTPVEAEPSLPAVRRDRGRIRLSAASMRDLIFEFTPSAIPPAPSPVK